MVRNNNLDDQNIPASTPPTRIFISHSHTDNKFAEQLAEDIEDSGIKCWLDLWEIEVGASIRQKVEDGIKAADWLIILLSEASVQSKWVKQES